MPPAKPAEIIWNGNDDLRPLLVPIAELHEDPGNVRKHGERSIRSVKGSLARFEQQKPIVVDNKGIVRAGNGTLASARELGWTHLAATRSKLSGVELAAYALADNRTAENSEWDYEALSETLRAIQEEGAPIDDLGWEPFEIEPLLAAIWTPEAVEELPDDGDGGDGTDGVAGPPGDPIVVSKAQRKVIDRAVAAVRESEGDPDLSEGRCLELICADYLAG